MQGHTEKATPPRSSVHSGAGSGDGERALEGKEEEEDPEDK